MAEIALPPMPWEVRDDPDQMGVMVVSARKPNGKRDKVLLFPLLVPREQQRAIAEYVVRLVNSASPILLGPGDGTQTPPRP